MTWSREQLLSLLACVDLTSLNEDDPPNRIESLCRGAAAAAVRPAAVCVYPEYVWLARQRLDAQDCHGVAVASVANFPEGGDDPLRAARECHRLRAAGADEVDVVLPYRALMAGDLARYRAVAQASREATGEAVLKCILETGELTCAERIEEAAEIALEAGADFLKTSTGKVSINATPAAAEIMLAAIGRNRRPCGFKAAGGIRRIEDALRYQQLSQAALGPAGGQPGQFRLGASALFEVLLTALNQTDDDA